MSETRNGSTGNDTITASKSGIWPIQWWTDWTIHGNDGNDSLTGGGDNDKLYGGTGLDTLYGLGGNDYLDGGSGDDVMEGGTGHDTYVVDSSTDRIIERSGEGTDWVNSHAYRFDLPDHVENLTLMDDPNRGIGRIGVGNSLNNRIEGNKWDNDLYGLGGNDTIFANGGIDKVYGGSGDDWLYGSAAGASLYGESGNDRLLGGMGDKLYGGIGDDTYSVTTKNNNGAIIVENAGEGVDTITVNLIDFTGTLRNDVYTLSESLQHIERVENYGGYNGAGATGITGLVGNSFNNTLVASSHLGNYLDGAGGNDVLVGGGYNDTLTGGAGADLLQGSGGNDHILGYGGGMDRMNGGAGADSFHLKDFYRDANYAVIQDFNRAQGDKISVRGLASDYRLLIVTMAGVSDRNDIGIYYRPTNTLVGVVQDNVNVSLATDFQYVA